MITVNQLTPENYDKWNAYVTSHPEASPYHLTGWKTAVESAYHHQTLYLIAHEQNRVVGVLPIVRLSPPLLKATYCALPFCDVGDCLADSPDVRDALYRRAIELTDGLVEVRYRAREPSDIKCLPATAKVSMLLDLPGSRDALWSSFKTKLRTRVRRAEKNGLTVRLGCNETLLGDFYSVMSENMRYLGSPVHAKAWFKAVILAYGEACILSVVYRDEKPTAAGLILRVGGIASIPWSSSLRSYNHLSPNMLLYWSLLSYCTDQGCTRLDFGRSTIGEGTFNFKQQWGAEPYPLYWHGLDQPRVETASGAKSTVRTLIESLWRRLPLSVTVSLGPQVRRFISL